MTKVEQVARALVQADEQNGGPPWDMHAGDKHVMEMRMGRARAAIEAMREPNRALVMLGLDVCDDAGCEDISGRILARAFTAMLDAALKEGT